MLNRILGVFLVGMLPFLAFAQANGKGPGIITQTRYVKLFGELENQLLQSSTDAAKLDTLLTSTFEVRRSDGQTIPRNEWIALSKNAASAKDSNISQLAVYEIGSYAVANFHLKGPDQAEKFIVDIWIPENDQWHLRARMESPVAR